MDLSIPEAESLLASTVRSFVTRVATTEVLVKVQDSTPDQISEWTRAMADAGWLGALIPTDFGGSDATCLQAAVICEELGRGPVPGPFLVSSVLSALILRAAERSAPRDELLDAIASGDAIVVPVLDRSTWSPTGLHLGTEYAGPRSEALSATVPFVPYAQAATHLLVPLAPQDGDEDVELAIVPAGAPGVATRRLPGLLAWNDEVTFTDVRLGGGTVLCGASEVAEALTEAYVLVAAYMVGGCQVLLERSVDYSNTRIQFSKPIGQFQRVQDHIVELVNALDAARWSTYQAIWQIDSERDSRVGAHMALAVASEAYVTCTDAAHKVHGGIGVDPQFGLTSYTQMARSLYGFLGKPLWHKRQMAHVLGWGRPR
jgi:alkylation response protein AidB-like acyl-CoA dehydrogenase